MLQQKFYHGIIRKSIIAFGNLFNNITIDRFNSSNEVEQSIRVPLSYAPKQKFLARIAAQPNSFEQSFQTFLPRLAFEMTGITYDPARRISLVQQNRALNSTNNTLNSQYAPTPYNINMVLYCYSKNQDDGLQIVEQILPYFNPHFNLNLKTVPALNIVNDLTIILDSINYEDEYEGDFVTRRAIIWTLNFTIKLNFYGPISRQSLIKKVTVNNFSDVELLNKQSTITSEVNPNTAIPGDSITIVDTFEDDF